MHLLQEQQALLPNNNRHYCFLPNPNTRIQDSPRNCSDIQGCDLERKSQLFKGNSELFERNSELYLRGEGGVTLLLVLLLQPHPLFSFTTHHLER